MKNKKYHAIIIGGGHNALVAACYLRFSKILVLERRSVLGGAALSEEVYPGFKFSRFSYLLSLMRPSIIEDLELYKHGLELYRRDISSITVTRTRGEYLLMGNDINFTKKEIAKFSQKDSENYEEYNRFLSRIIDIWSYYQDRYPIDPKAPLKIGDAKLYAKAAYDLFKNRLRVNDYVQFLTQSSSQFLDHWFESDILKGTLITDGIIGEMTSIDTPASAYVLLHHVMGEIFPNSKGEWAFVKGGMGSISTALALKAQEKGVEILTNSPVDQILIQQGRAIGVEVNGEEIFAERILSSCTPRVTFDQLLQGGKKIKDKRYLESIKHIEYNGACSKFNFAVSELPRFTCFEGTEYSDPASILRGTVHIGCENLTGLRQAFADVSQGKLRLFSNDLFIDLVVPSVYDNTLAPPGRHVVQCLVQYTPYKGWVNARKQDLIDHVIDRITSYAPNFRKSIIYTDALTPFDIEHMLNMTEGNIFHGALTLDRLYANRPTNGYNSYGTPIGGLYLCGSGAHPGGGVMGAPGRNCALYVNDQS